MNVETMLIKCPLSRYNKLQLSHIHMNVETYLTRAQIEILERLLQLSHIHMNVETRR